MSVKRTRVGIQRPEEKKKRIGMVLVLDGSWKEDTKLTGAQELLQKQTNSG